MNTQNLPLVVAETLTDLRNVQSALLVDEDTAALISDSLMYEDSETISQVVMELIPDGEPVMSSLTAHGLSATDACIIDACIEIGDQERIKRVVKSHILKIAASKAKKLILH